MKISTIVGVEKSKPHVEELHFASFYFTVLH